LKTLAAEPTLTKNQNLAEKLEAALPPKRLELLKTAAAKAQSLHMAVYIVGGFVRDLLLDRPSLDFDLVVEGNAISLGKALVADFGGRVVIHRQFGTAKWLPADQAESLDLITARTEFYERPTALPTVEVGNIKLDLHRRDFTINTLALRLDGRHYGELHNYWGGLNDLRLGIVRVLHSLSFIDDPTRLLRAVRFEQRFGFRIEVRTLQLMEEARPLLKQVSGDRLRHELNLILAEDKAIAMLSRLDTLGILVAIHPEIPWNEDIARHLARKISPEEADEWDLPEGSQHMSNVSIRIGIPYLIWLGQLKPDSVRSVARRLKLSANLTDALAAASDLLDNLSSLENLRPSQLVERLEGIPLISIYAVYQVAPEGPARWALQNYAVHLRHVSPINNGNSLKARGLPPSSRYRYILKTLRDAWLDGKINNIDEEEALLGELLHGNSHVD
jgi:tRNA nucleotidyltransferase (CCA-adding enzyme)